jgi:NAD(P)-dependent dehydrogenase (short-subunit alcohol dehydrogenase family)
MRIVITGANRGIGLELTRQYLARGETVEAAVRDPDGASKAALNMANKSMSVDLAGEGFTCLVINPGWVQTDMGGKSAPTTVENSAKGLIGVIDRASADDNGKFLNWTGEEKEW